MNCPRCGKANEDGNQFCGRCGLDFSEYEQTAHPIPEDEIVYCYRHKKTPTNLRCGRCDKPICAKCAVIGPAGPRCPECAKQNIPIRGRAIAHEAKRTFSSLFRINPWTIYIVIILLGVVFGGLRGCGMFSRSHVPVDSSQYEQDSYRQSDDSE